MFTSKELYVIIGDPFIAHGQDGEINLIHMPWKDKRAARYLLAGGRKPLPPPTAKIAATPNSSATRLMCMSKKPWMISVNAIDIFSGKMKPDYKAIPAPICASSVKLVRRSPMLDSWDSPGLKLTVSMSEIGSNPVGRLKTSLEESKLRCNNKNAVGRIKTAL